MNLLGISLTRIEVSIIVIFEENVLFPDVCR